MNRKLKIKREPMPGMDEACSAKLTYHKKEAEVLRRRLEYVETKKLELTLINTELQETTVMREAQIEVLETRMEKLRKLLEKIKAAKHSQVHGTGRKRHRDKRAMYARIYGNKSLAEGIINETESQEKIGPGENTEETLLSRDITKSITGKTVITEVFTRRRYTEDPYPQEDDDIPF